MLKALIFDVDGTLAETEELHRESFNAAFRDTGLDWTWDRESYTALLTTTGGKERIARFVSEQRLPHLGAAEVRTLHLAKNEKYAEALVQRGLTLRPGMAQLITEAKHRGLKLGIATTTSTSNLVALLACCFGENGGHIFDATVCSEDVNRKKPDPQVYQVCLERLGARPSEAIAFEDSGVGLAAALAAGLRTIITPGAYTKNDNFAGASAILDDLCGGLEACIDLCEAVSLAAQGSAKFAGS